MKIRISIVERYFDSLCIRPRKVIFCDNLQAAVAVHTVHRTDADLSHGELLGFQQSC